MGCVPCGFKAAFGWWRSVVVNALTSIKLSTLGPITTWIGGLRAGKHAIEAIKSNTVVNFRHRIVREEI